MADYHEAKKDLSKIRESMYRLREENERLRRDLWRANLELARARQALVDLAATAKSVAVANCPEPWRSVVPAIEGSASDAER